MSRSGPVVATATRVSLTCDIRNLTRPNRIVLPVTRARVIASLLLATGCGKLIDPVTHDMDAAQAKDANDVEILTDASSHPCPGSIARPLWAASYETWDVTVAGLQPVDDGLWIAGKFRRSIRFDHELAASDQESGFLAKLTPAGVPVFSERLGGGLPTDRVDVTDVAGGGGGHVAIVGGFWGQMAFRGANGSEVVLDNPASRFAPFLTHFDETGALAWHHQFPVTPVIPPVIRIATDSDGRTFVVGVLGAEFPDLRLSVAGYDPDGAELFLWSTPASSLAADIVVDGSGNVVIAAFFANARGIPDAADFCPGLSATTSATCIFSLDSQGHYRWGRRFASGPPRWFGNTMLVDSDGNLILAGTFSGAIDLGADGFADAAIAVDAGSALVSAGADDIYLAKLNASGSLLWQKRFGDADEQGVTSVAALPEGHLLLSGGFRGNLDFGSGVHPLVASESTPYLAELDANGHAVFAQQLEIGGQVTHGGPIGSTCNTFYIGGFGVPGPGQLAEAGASKPGLIVSRMRR